MASIRRSERISQRDAGSWDGGLGLVEVCLPEEHRQRATQFLGEAAKVRNRSDCRSDAGLAGLLKQSKSGSDLGAS